MHSGRPKKAPAGYIGAKGESPLHTSRVPQNRGTLSLAGY